MKEAKKRKTLLLLMETLRTLRIGSRRTKMNLIKRKAAHPITTHLSKKKSANRFIKKMKKTKRTSKGMTV